jgi:hypothetical protein
MPYTNRPMTHRRNVVRRGSEQEFDHVIAVDLGHVRDFTALVELKRVDDPARDQPIYHVGHLKRFPLGTQTPEISEYLSSALARKPLANRTGLIVDGTGAGTPIVQEMRRCGLPAVPIYITGGQKANGSNVPKQQLLSLLLLLLQQRRLKIPQDVRLRAELVEEFNNFMTKRSPSGYLTGSAAAGAHDDLIMALTLACYFFEYRRRRTSVDATIVSGESRGPMDRGDFFEWLRQRERDQMLSAWSDVIRL